MSLKEKLAAKQSELAELKAGIEAGEAEAVASAKSIMDEIDGLTVAIDIAEKSNSILDSMKSDDVEVSSKGYDKTVGDAAARLVKEAGFHNGMRLHITTPEMKTLQNTDPVSGWTETEQTHRVIELPHRNLVFADLFGSESLTGTSTAKEIIVEKPTAGDFDVVAEGGKKPQISWEYEKKTVSIEKIAGFIKLTDEFVEDAAYLVSVINGRLAHKLAIKEENELVSALLGTSGLQTLEYDTTDDKGMAEAVLKAQTLITNNTDYKADAVVLNPADYEALRLTKDSNGQYYGGGFFTGEYNNGDIQNSPNLWGLRTLVSPAVAQGTVIVGDFKTAAAVLRKGGVRVDMTNSNEDDFIHNLVLTRMEERVGLAVYVPAAFVVITAESDTDTDSDTDTE